ncbi:hypothetical protein LSH36_144g04046 [Paralvinella palmiformis]|uniref:Peptidoglycan recognition protein family domain-containing protein n=1 Tax=Paralvinella palmiformis TaxID=53620 RepID=A0AAD9N7N5_9ANNE|nr:hypothetical protein LSH36_144g04046 [Paralvinella palmiformis]
MINCAQCQHRLEEGGSVKNRVTNENDFSYDKREILPGACKERHGTPGGFTNCDYCQASVDESELNDIGCNFLVGNDGRIYEGRGWKFEGQHVEGFNDGYITEDYELFGHRDAVQTMCPGDCLYSIIQRWPHFANGNLP